MIRAIQCDIKHIWLPEEEWTIYDDVSPQSHSYNDNINKVAIAEFTIRPAL
jgi:hypothetical protein